MIGGIGTDIIEIKRIEQSIKDYGQKFLDRLFTLKEQDYCKKHREAGRHFSGRFAAKEAIAKALGTGIGETLGWLDIEIINDKSGKPTLVLSDNASLHFLNPMIHITISHCNDYAVAFAVYEK